MSEWLVFDPDTGVLTAFSLPVWAAALLVCVPLVVAALIVFAVLWRRRRRAAKAEAEAKGLYMPNSAASLLTLNRRKLHTFYKALHIEAPEGYDETNLPQDLSTLSYPCWLKRDDGCAQHADDVQFISIPEELSEALDLFKMRGIQHFITESHTEGDLLKFYGVADTEFFFVYPSRGSNGYSKFGLERFNAPSRNYKFDLQALKQQMNTLAKAFFST